MATFTDEQVKMILNSLADIKIKKKRKEDNILGIFIDPDNCDIDYEGFRKFMFGLQEIKDLIGVDYIVAFEKKYDKIDFLFASQNDLIYNAAKSLQRRDGKGQWRAVDLK